MTTETKDLFSDKLRSARESFNGRLLTDAQFKDAIAITGVIEREIWKSGSFKDKLGDYAFAFARSERFDALKAENIVRDLFKERTGQTMNALRGQLVDKELKITDPQKRMAYDHACIVGDVMEKGDKMSFYRASAQQAQALSRELGITEITAKRLMADEFNAVEKIEFKEWGKELDERHYRPQIDAERQKRETAPEAISRPAPMVRSGRTGPTGP